TASPVARPFGTFRYTLSGNRALPKRDNALSIRPAEEVKRIFGLDRIRESPTLAFRSAHASENRCGGELAWLPLIVHHGSVFLSGRARSSAQRMRRSPPTWVPAGRRRGTRRCPLLGSGRSASHRTAGWPD